MFKRIIFYSSKEARAQLEGGFENMAQQNEDESKLRSEEERKRREAREKREREEAKKREEMRKRDDDAEIEKQKMEEEKKR